MNDTDWDDVNWKKKMKQETELMKRFGSIPKINQKAGKELKAKEKKIKKLSPPDGKALLYVMRSSQYSVRENLMMLMINGTHFNTFKGHQFCHLVLDPGKHVLEARIQHKGALIDERHQKCILNVVSNNTYFVDVRIIDHSQRRSSLTGLIGAMIAKNHFVIQILDNKKGKSRLTGCRLVEHDLEFPIPALQENEKITEEEKSRTNEKKVEEKKLE
ncbi:MAG: hypothetical protein ACFFAS_17990 [Promethearchaeota archaeon]